MELIALTYLLMHIYFFWGGLPHLPLFIRSSENERKKHLLTSKVIIFIFHIRENNLKIKTTISKNKVHMIFHKEIKNMFEIINVTYSLYFILF